MRLNDLRIGAIVAVAAFLVCVAVTKPHIVSWNDGSRFATIDALTANHTVVLDGSPLEPALGDKIKFRGKTYSDKPPLLSLAGALVAFALAPLGITLRGTPGTAIYLITLFTIGPWFAAGAAYAYALQRRLGFPPRSAAAVAALSAVGTLALPYATVLTNHVPCGVSALIAYGELVRARSPSHLGRGVAIAGVFLGLCYAFDAAGFVVSIGAALLLWGLPVRAWVLTIAAGAPIVALQFGYNLAISGSVLPTAFNAAVWSDPSLPLSWWSRAVFHVYGVADYASFVLNLTLGSRGLLSFTPLYVLAAIGLAAAWRGGGLPQRLASAIGTTAGVYFLMILFLQNDTNSANFGERRYVDVSYLLCVGLGWGLAIVRGALGIAAARAAIAASVAIAALGTVAPFAGGANESGFVFGAEEFGALLHRAPVQGGLDIIALLLLLAGVLVLVPFDRARGFSAAPQRA